MSPQSSTLAKMLNRKRKRQLETVIDYQLHPRQPDNRKAKRRPFP